MSDAVRDVIYRYPPEARDGVLALRRLIFDVARGLPEIGPLDETLKWGQPAYLPRTPRTGSTLRAGLHKDAQFALFAHCQTTIISSYARAFPGWDRLDGNRAVLFDAPGQIEPERLSYLVRHALTYHLRNPNGPKRISTGTALERQG
ncbi:hypothetical protein A3731_13150 [Roseovarius sp. HI0049]|nr:hypothetical protein A3731_13150 [Roseovarius sp. HI0049]